MIKDKVVGSVRSIVSSVHKCLRLRCVPLELLCALTIQRKYIRPDDYYLLYSMTYPNARLDLSRQQFSLNLFL